jgi:hypothetical protein
VRFWPDPTVPACRSSGGRLGHHPRRVSDDSAAPQATRAPPFPRVGPSVPFVMRESLRRVEAAVGRVDAAFGRVKAALGCLEVKSRFGHVKVYFDWTFGRAVASG